MCQHVWQRRVAQSHRPRPRRPRQRPPSRLLPQPLHSARDATLNRPHPTLSGLSPRLLTTCTDRQAAVSDQRVAVSQRPFSHRVHSVRCRRFWTAKRTARSPRVFSKRLAACLVLRRQHLHRALRTELRRWRRPSRSLTTPRRGTTSIRLRFDPPT